MQNWTNEMWTAVVIAFIIGLIIGYVVLGLTKGSVKKHVKLEKEFKKVKAEKEVQKQHLEAHFSESAVLLSTLAKDYKKLYTHLAEGSEKLLPEAHSIELFNQLQLENDKKEEQPAETKVEAEIEVDQKKDEIDTATVVEEKSETPAK
ncbi:Putative cytochrome d ubiquinol oxidase subunit 3 [Phocoenobacter uteri]|uniref:Z-ring associated protein G n=1 Tax=Phocoenobacter uteri TaxID=146806 RepID=A0A379C7Q0_9PAST|nr:DUF1043 family protein [Phocoenobacter uteri]SUB58304.1 Putative cytochrome d ubiquinol oxidase subunit 3 [Phocoenobacter uteri]